MKKMMMMAMILLCTSLFAQRKDRVFVIEGGATDYKGIKVELGMGLNDLITQLKAKSIPMEHIWVPNHYSVRTEDSAVQFVADDIYAYFSLKDGLLERDTFVESIGVSLRSYSYRALNMDGVLINYDMDLEEVTALLASQGVKYRVRKGSSTTRVFFRVKDGLYCTLIWYDPMILSAFIRLKLPEYAKDLDL